MQLIHSIVQLNLPTGGGLRIKHHATTHILIILFSKKYPKDTRQGMELQMQDRQRYEAAAALPYQQ
jgi:hypothetical protein